MHAHDQSGHHFSIRRCLALVLLYCAACAADGEGMPGLGEQEAEPTPVEVTSAPILNGSTPDHDTNVKGGFVALADRRSDGSIRVFCSGALFSNTHLITARHCLTHPALEYLQDRPGSLLVQLAPNNARGQVRIGKSIWFPRSSIDYAIIEVAAPFSMPRNSDGLVSTIGFTRQFNTVPTNTPVICFGHGRNVENCDSSGNNCTGSGVGILRWATLTATVFDAGDRNMYRFRPNGQNQLHAHGDSGSVCVAPTRSFAEIWKQPIITVLSTCFPGEFCNAEMAAFAMFDGWDKVSP